MWNISKKLNKNTIFFPPLTVFAHSKYGKKKIEIKFQNDWSTLLVKLLLFGFSRTTRPGPSSPPLSDTMTSFNLIIELRHIGNFLERRRFPVQITLSSCLSAQPVWFICCVCLAGLRAHNQTGYTTEQSHQPISFFPPLFLIWFFQHKLLHLRFNHILIRKNVHIWCRIKTNNIAH